MNVSEPRAIAVSGAAGFLGQATVRAARASGHPVRALVRRADAAPDAWAADPDITVVPVDLADVDPDDLRDALGEASAVIHAAAAFAGSETVQARDTQRATAALLDALVGKHEASDRAAPRLVLVSSLAVYGHAALPDGAVLDETAATEPDASRRDAYARAKLAQERLAVAASQRRGLDLWIMRPGPIYGPGRTDTARLGIRFRGRLLCPGGAVPIPAIQVDNCARALVSAASAKRFFPSDFPVVDGDGHVSIVNLVDPDPPTQADWLTALGAPKPIRLPRGMLFRVAGLLDLAADMLPWLDRRLPSRLRLPALTALYKPLSYSVARAEDRLGFAPSGNFREAMGISVAASRERDP